MLCTDKAYVLGLLVGGGHIGQSSFTIKLPYKKWGDVDANPRRATQIVKDVLKILNPMMQNCYGVSFTLDMGNVWHLNCDSIPSELIDDLQRNEINTRGELRKMTSIKTLMNNLSSKVHKHKFVAGLADTIGSFAKSHRRFNDEFQIVSFEFKGRNYELVGDVITLFNELRIPIDQVLWNHPNQHSGSCKYYKQWKKGFKIRVALQDYILKEAVFVFIAKKESADENVKMNAPNATAEFKPPKIKGRVTIHSDQSSDWLPQNLRDIVFPHNLWFNSVLQLPLSKTENKFILDQSPESLFCPFTILTKGQIDEIKKIQESDEVLAKEKHISHQLDFGKLLDSYNQNQNQLILGRSESDGFPINTILRAVEYAAYATFGERMKGKRVLGKFKENLNVLRIDPRLNKLGLTIDKPLRGTALIVSTNKNAALVGYVNNSFNKKLVHKIDRGLFSVGDFDYEQCVEI